MKNHKKYLNQFVWPVVVSRFAQEALSHPHAWPDHDRDAHDDNDHDHDTRPNDDDGNPNIMSKET